jgi:O-antigen/teichoic acid export membrane protein
MSLLKRTSRAYAWGQIGRLAEACLFFVFSLLLARILGPRTYGIYSLAVSTAGLLGFLTLLGIVPETFGRFVPDLAATQGPHAVRVLLRKLLAVRGLTAVGTIIFAVVFSVTTFGQAHLKFLSGTLACVLLLFAVRGFYDLLVGYPGALLELKQVAIAKVLAGITAPLLFLMFVLVHRVSAGSALFITAISYLLGAIWLLVPWIRKEPEPHLNASNSIALSQVLRFGFFVWMVNFFILVLSDNTDVLLVDWILGDATFVGYYAVGARLVFRLVTLVLGWVPLFAVASLNHGHLEGGPDKMALVMQAQWKLCMVSAVAPLALLYSFAEPIVRVLFSSSYLPSVHIVRILALLMMCSAACGFTLHSSILYVLNRERLACWVMGTGAVFNVLLEIYLVRRIGISGAAWATGISYLILSITLAIIGAKLLPLRTPWQFNLKVAGAAAVALVASYWLTPDSVWQLVGACSFWTAVFLFTLVLLKPLALADSRHLVNLNPWLGSLAETLFVSRARVLEEEQISC